METNDLYRPPQANLNAPTAPVDGGISARMIELMGKTRPWVFFLAVLGFIAMALMLVGGLGFTVAMAVGETPGMASLGLVYILMAVLYFFPCNYLLKYARAIKDLTNGGGATALEEAIERQYNFWRFVGIMTAVLMSLYALILVGGIIMAVVMGGMT